MNEDYISAEEAAALLGVSVSTIYAYVGRKGIRSQPIAGSRQRRYWRSDIEALRRKTPNDVKGESSITLLSPRGPYYRGKSAIELAETCDLETIAALLWEVERDEVFGATAPRGTALVAAVATALAGSGANDRAVAIFPLLEEANPRSYDLSPAGMARSGADVLRWLCAVILGRATPSAEPLHRTVQQALGLAGEYADLARRLMVLSADHGFEPATLAVRAAAATGVSPWRAVLTGLSVASGRRNRFGRMDSIRRFLAEVLAAQDPAHCVLGRLREGEALPGFVSTLYPEGDPRAPALLHSCREMLGGDLEFQRLDRAIATVKEVCGALPEFALAAMFVDRKLGIGSLDSLFMLGRSAGWIAHAIEQYRAGEAEHREGKYRGKLPS